MQPNARESYSTFNKLIKEINSTLYNIILLYVALSSAVLDTSLGV